VAESDGRYVRVNAAVERTLGYTEAEFLAMPFPELVHPDDRAATRALTQIARIEGQLIERFENRYRCKDGTYRWLEWTSSFAEGHYYSVARDVTARRAAADALQASERRFRALVQGASDLIVVLRADGRLQYLSPAAQRLLGYHADEMVGSDPFVLVHPEDAGRCRRAFAAVAGGDGGIPTLELRLRHADGSWRWAESRATNLLDEPSVAGIVLNIRDVSERKRADDALRESEERFRSLFENAPIGLYRASPDGRILLANAALARMLGHARADDLIGTDLAALAISASSEPVTGEASVTGAVGAETTWMRADGAPLIVRGSTQLIRHDDGSVRFIEGTVEDVTEQRRLVAQLGQAERLAALGEMAAGLAHEVNNPLAVIALRAELCLASGVPPQLHGDLDLIHREALRAGDIVRTLLRFAHPRDPSYAPVQLAKVAEEAISLRGDRLARFHITVEREFVAAPDILGDRDQLFQVFLNLINNAVDAMRSHGQGWLTVRIAPSAEGVAVSVRDTGAGLPPDQVDRLFNPFFSTKPVGEGTGLGLSLCHRIVTDHHGAIRAENVRDGGACFRITLPVARETVGPAAPSGTKHVLVAHPDAAAGSALAEAVRLLGYGTAGYTSEALYEVTADYDCILIGGVRTDELALWFAAQAPQARLVDLRTLPHGFGLDALQRALEGEVPA
jgi:two-component system NtrC family sensor kinase